MLKKIVCVAKKNKSADVFINFNKKKNQPSP